jgi:dTDP-4-amino-4,6-dideoxygalactose transaminase
MSAPSPADAPSKSDVAPRSRVFCQPGFPAPSLLRLRAAAPPFDSASVTYCHRGSTALASAITQLKLAPGDGVLFPSYHCGVELDGLVQRGLAIRFYDVDQNLRFDVNRLASLVDERTRLLYLIHYFGVPGPTDDAAAFCATHSLSLLEDCAQALYSRDRGRAIGSTGSVAIFSLRKTLGIPSGGALVTNDRSLEPPALQHGPGWSISLRKTARLAAMEVGAGAIGEPAAGVVMRRIGRSFDIEEPEGETTGPIAAPIAFNPAWASMAMSPLSRFLVEHTNHEEIVRRRRANFERLLMAMRGLRSITPLVTEVPSGACPLMFPVVVHESRGDFIQFCRQRGVSADSHWPYVHPIFPAADYPAARRLKKQVAALPVHQGLRDSHLARIESVLRQWELSPRISRVPQDEMMLQPAGK